MRIDWQTYLAGLATVLVLCVLWTEYRIERLREPINRNAVYVGIDEGIAQYKKEIGDNESFYLKKRKARDAEVRRYVKHLDKLMDKIKGEE